MNELEILKFGKMRFHSMKPKDYEKDIVLSYTFPRLMSLIIDHRKRR